VYLARTDPCIEMELINASRTYPQSIDTSKLNAQKAITSYGPQFTQFTGEELQVKFLSDFGENSLKH
jgi:hypothetical protein